MPLPLALRKAFRDDEPKKLEHLAKLSATSGKSVTYTWDQEAVYNALEGQDTRAQLSEISNAYLESLISAVETSFKDDMVKKSINDAWTTSNVLFAVHTDAEYKKVQSAAGSTGGNYYNLRMVGGAIEMGITPGNLWTNVGQICYEDLTKIIATAAGDLPLQMKKEIRDLQPSIDAEVAKIRALKGVSDATFDFDAAAIFKSLGGDFSTGALTEYISGMREGLEKMWKDDMVAEGILEHWKAPHKIRIFVDVNMDAEKGTVVKSSYHGIRLKDGCYDMLVGKGYWWTNTGQIYNHDLTSVL